MNLERMYENFSILEVGGNRIAEEDVEDEKLNSFEAGYKCGWKDAEAAQKLKETELISALQVTIDELVETKSNILREYEIRISEFLQSVTNCLTQSSINFDSLNHHIAEFLRKLEGLDNTSATVFMSPKDAGELRNLLPEFGGMVTFLDDPTLLSGTVVVRWDDQEAEVSSPFDARTIESLISKLQKSQREDHYAR